MNCDPNLVEIARLQAKLDRLRDLIADAKTEILVASTRGEIALAFTIGVQLRRLEDASDV